MPCHNTTGVGLSWAWHPSRTKSSRGNICFLPSILRFQVASGLGGTMLPTVDSRCWQSFLCSSWPHKTLGGCYTSLVPAADGWGHTVLGTTNRLSPHSWQSRAPPQESPHLLRLPASRYCLWHNTHYVYVNQERVWKICIQSARQPLKVTRTWEMFVLKKSFRQGKMSDSFRQVTWGRGYCQWPF